MGFIPGRDPGGAIGGACLLGMLFIAVRGLPLSGDVWLVVPLERG